VIIYCVTYPASDSLQIEAVALDLLADRLPNVSDRLHGEIAPIVERILSSIRRVVPLHPDGPLPLAAFRALRIIITTTSPGQGNALTDLVPLILTSIKNRKMTASAMAVLPPLMFVFSSALSRCF
jgi:U3 small nucleolar RNA-associated protein 10